MTLFNEFPIFGEELLIKAFREKPTEEFLLTETEDLIEELVADFGDWIEKSTIGYKTHEGRMIELVKFKELSTAPKVSSVLFDGAHHSRELITIKMTLSILLKLLHGIHYKDTEIL